MAGLTGSGTLFLLVTTCSDGFLLVAVDFSDRGCAADLALHGFGTIVFGLDLLIAFLVAILFVLCRSAVFLKLLLGFFLFIIFGYRDVLVGNSGSLPLLGRRCFLSCRQTAN